MTRRILAAPLALALLPLAALATPFDFNGTSVEVEYWAGTGPNMGMLVVDFNPGRSYAFGYRWEQAATGFDMLGAIADAGGLDFTFTDWGGALGIGINTLQYGAEAMGTVGYPADYVYYYVGRDGLAWSESGAGPSHTTLANGDWNGWSQQTVGWPGPYSPPLTPVPEPSALALFALGAGALAWRRRAGRAAPTNHRP